MDEQIENENEIINDEKINEEANNNECVCNDIQDVENGNENEKGIEENKDPLEVGEDEINKEDIDNIVDFLSHLDYEKYSRDMEIKEALMILKTKFDKDQEQKDKEAETQNEKIKIIEDKNLTIYKDKDKNNEQNLNEENIITNNKNQKNGNENNIKDNEMKENKEIIDEEEIKKKKKIERYKIAEKIAKCSELKDVHSVQSVQKLLLRENVDDEVPLRITIIKENPIAGTEEYTPNKLPFLRSLPLI